MILDVPVKHLSVIFLKFALSTFNKKKKKKKRTFTMDLGETI